MSTQNLKEFDMSCYLIWQSKGFARKCSS